MEFTQPTRARRRRILDRYLGGAPVRPAWLDRMAANPDLAPALIEQGAKVVSLLGIEDALGFERAMERVLVGSLRAMGHRGPVLPVETEVTEYGLEYVNADGDLKALTAGLKRQASARLCLYGPPGTGKTAYARYLAAALDRPLLVKRASDILSRWWGGTEANIARMFEEALAEEAVLLLDEVDSLLKDRGSVTHYWEASEVNELLTQMETFPGLFIASTNRIDHLDAASLRRFDFKVGFGYMDPAQRRTMFEDVLRAHGPAVLPLAGTTTRRLDALERLTPGDFAVSTRRARVTGETLDAEALLSSLEAESRHKRRGETVFMGFTGGA
jgi:SpoVK/Ycf46/Vps4 family AAA+-type ATPase